MGCLAYICGDILYLYIEWVPSTRIDRCMGSISLRLESELFDLHHDSYTLNIPKYIIVCVDLNTNQTIFNVYQIGSNAMPMKPFLILRIPNLSTSHWANNRTGNCRKMCFVNSNYV